MQRTKGLPAYGARAYMGFGRSFTRKDETCKKKATAPASMDTRIQQTFHVDDASAMPQPEVVESVPPEELPHWRTLEGQAAVMSDILLLIRIRIVISCIQSGGQFRVAAEKSLRAMLRTAPAIGIRFIRWLLHPATKVEHFFRFLDCTSRKLILLSLHYKDSEVWQFAFRRW